MKLAVRLLGSLLLLGTGPVAAQDGAAVAPAAPKLVHLEAGKHYAAGSLHRLLFGTHYRPLWTAPLDVEELDLDLYGGLHPTEQGGGQQTRALRFTSGDGREFAFRSIDKDPSQVLPPDLRGTFADDIVQDQISAAHPAGALVVPPLLDAAGVYHSTPRLVVMPDDARLLGFRSQFAGLLGLFEERAIADDEHGGGIPGATKIINSDNLFERIEKSPDDRVDSRALLTARLMDEFLGDWDRHRDQWRWARFGDDHPTHWVPIPRDRDQAFVRFDGILLTVARGPVPQLVNFGPKYPGPLGLTWNGRELDRRFLTDLEWPVWDSTATHLTAVLTDSVIEVAVSRLPPAYAALDSARLAKALKSRRDALTGAAKAFYRLLAKEVDVHATDAAEVAEFDAAADRSVTLSIRQAGDSVPYYRRRFVAGETGEIRLFLHGGDDEAIVRGTGGIRVRVIGGGGQDTLLDSTSAGSPRFYDVGKETVASGTSVNHKRYVLDTLHSETALPPRDWGSRSFPFLWSSGSPDVGLLIGGALKFTDYGFRQQPYASRHVVRAGYATGAQTFKSQYDGDFRAENSGRHVTILARASGIETAMFHGLGNETTAKGSKSFFRVKEYQFTLEPALAVSAGDRLTASFGPTATWVDTRFTGDRFIDQAKPYGSGKFGQVGGRADLIYDSRDLPAYARRGVYLEANGSAFPAVWDVDEAFATLQGEARTYLSPKLPLSPTLALRAGAKRVFGAAPYQAAAYIGDASTVRLGRQNRYGGDASVYGSAELRFFVSKYRIVVPGEFGIFGLGDVGRVFLDGENSDQWHSAAGGGIWIGFLGHANLISIAYAQSKERGSVYVQAGMPF